MEMYDQPTEPKVPRPEDMPPQPSLLAPNETFEAQTLPQAPVFPASRPTFSPAFEDSVQQVAFPAVAGAVPPPSMIDRPKRAARRTFMGKSLAGLTAIGGAALLGGVALGEWLNHGGANSLDNLLHGNAATATAVQTGHLLRKAGFGATADEVQTYKNLGFQGSVDRLLNYQSVDDSAMEQRLQALNIDLTKPVDQQRWWLLRMAWSQRPLLEKMTLFWHGVLTSSFRKVGGAKGYSRMITQNNFLRAHAFDTFDNILLGITSDPAMLVYLDLNLSRRTHPNENYARELMELFTVGLANYTQPDVFAGSAALTGWHVRGDTSYYNPNDHSTLPVRFMGQTGSFDYKDIIRILAAHPATPWFICRKLFTFFVY